MLNAVNYIVGKDYFKAMEIPLLQGRLITPQDDARQQFVAVIDEDSDQTYFAGQNPVGNRRHLAGLDMPFEVVGLSAT